MSDTSMKEFWDARADEDPFYFVDNRLAYRRPDMERFWAGGEEALDSMLDALGVSVASTDSIVEVGCGIGRITRVLANRGADVRALDVSARMIDLARAHNQDLRNVRWILGDGRTLAGIDSESADVCHSHVVFQHIPEPEITMGYVREMGRVLRSGGWAAFQVSNQPSVHRGRPTRERVRTSLRSLVRRGPRGQAHRAWLGSAIDLDHLHVAAREGGLEPARVSGEDTQFCFVLLRKAP